MSLRSIFQFAAIAIALVNTVSAQSSTTDLITSVTEISSSSSNTTTTIPTLTPSISSTLLTNTTSPPYSTTTSPTYPLHNTTTNSSTQHSTHSKPADVTTKVIVTETADGVPTETRVAPSRTGTATECAEAGPSCTVLASSAHTSEKASLLGVLGPLAVVAGAFAILL
ncbi:hypothetical protein IFR04_005125 [Cadophora malorum]|uniref:GPI anchored protein n=1 Tax=Cadophora malorum TaxID=108018 RepID=A0A8H7TLE1_9HELO|nr:hypothetical protein IFR04_005125 [Cadophora malorum]